MYKHIILLGFLTTFNVVILGQTKRIDLQITNYKLNNTHISFNLTITNMSDTLIRTYLPQKEDICHHLLKVKFVNINTGQIHDLFPCNKITDLDCIVLDSLNTLSLKPQESFEQKFNFPQKQIIPQLKKGSNYYVYVDWYLNDVYFESTFQDIFKENVESNRINVSRCSP
jgi:hypothetical protein